MINDQELLFVVDEANRPLSALPRRVVHEQRLWHRVASVWVINNSRQLLCHKRSLRKDINPGKWSAFFGGHLGRDSTYLQTAAAELSEELGIALDVDRLIAYKEFKSDKPTHREFQQIFAYRLDTSTVDEFAFEKDEIDELRWHDLAEVEQILLRDDRPDWGHKPWDAEVLRWLSSLG